MREDFILTELEAIGKDLEALVEQGRDRLAEEEKSRQAAEERRKKGEVVGVITRKYDPNKLMPELTYLEARLRAVMDYMTAPAALTF